MRLTVGIVTYNSEKVVSRCLESVMTQTGLGETGKDWKIICLDNASNDRIALIRLEKRFPQVRFLRQEKNRGFARGHNIIMRMFHADFHAVLNCDVLLSSDFLQQLLCSLDEQPRYGSAVGKLLQWNISGIPEKTTFIDSVGIGVTKSHAFFDIGQGTLDMGQYKEQAERFGGSGAAIVYRRLALEEVAYTLPSPEPQPQSEPQQEYFDATMFLYKEDVDLAYRLLAVGHPCLYIPQAIAWHARSLGKGQKRSQKPAQKRIWSTAHESLLLRKHTAWWPRGIRLKVAFRQLLKWAYLLFAEPRVFFEAHKLLKQLKPAAEMRRKTTQHTIPFESIAHLFH